MNILLVDVPMVFLEERHSRNTLPENLLQAGRYFGRRTGDPLRRKTYEESVPLKALKSDVNSFANFVVNWTGNFVSNCTA